MDWNIDWITEDNFKTHIRNTILKYENKLVSYDVAKFNSNIIDPIKMIFDKSVYGYDWDDMTDAEIFRQRDKSNNNEIGYFHQKLFEYIDGCEVPDEGWDVIYTGAYTIDDRIPVSKIYVEMKNKHNTMNSSAAADTYQTMQQQILDDDDCVCMLVEIIAKKSQDITWKKNGRNNNRIRRVSIDKFMEIVTGEADAFYKMCKALPEAIQEVLAEGDSVDPPTDTVLTELRAKAEEIDPANPEEAMILAMYSLGFSTYNGFDEEE